MTCPQCGTKNPRGSRFCTRCGASLTGPVSASAPRRRGPTGRGCLGCLGIGVVILIALVVIGNLIGSPGQQTAAPAATATAGPTSTPPPASTQTAIARSVIHAGRVATAQARAAATTAALADLQASRQGTSQAVADETAQAAAADATQETILPQEQADFRSFAGRLLGIQDMCLAAGKIATASFQAVATGGGDAVQAYTDADNAQAACDAAKNAAALVSVPDSLSSLKLDNAPVALFSWATDEGNLWNDDKKVLQNPSDIATAADVSKMSKAIQSDSDQLAIPLAVGSVQLKVPVASITPTAPE